MKKQTNKKLSLKERKEKYKSIVLDNLSTERKITREEMQRLTKLDDRTIRNHYEEISMLYGLLSNSKEAGTRLVNMDLEDANDIEREINEIQHSLNELTTRYEKIRAKKRALIACQKVLKKKLETIHRVV
jgi:hypothetical protein